MISTSKADIDYTRKQIKVVLKFMNKIHQLTPYTLFVVIFSRKISILEYIPNSNSLSEVKFPNGVYFN